MAETGQQRPLLSCRCWYVDGTLCADCDQEIVRLQYAGDHTLIRANELERLRDLEQAAIDYWACNCKESCDCSVPLGWQVVIANLERGEIQELGTEAKHAIA